jgi:hypothetical protein
LPPLPASRPFNHARLRFEPLKRPLACGCRNPSSAAQAWRVRETPLRRRERVSQHRPPQSAHVPAAQGAPGLCRSQRPVFLSHSGIAKLPRAHYIRAAHVFSHDISICAYLYFTNLVGAVSRPRGSLPGDLLHLACARLRSMQISRAALCHRLHARLAAHRQTRLSPPREFPALRCRRGRHQKRKACSGYARACRQRWRRGCGGGDRGPNADELHRGVRCRAFFHHPR